MARETTRPLTQTSCMRDGCIRPWMFMCTSQLAPPIGELCGFRSCDDDMHYCDHSVGSELNAIRFIDIACIL